MLLFNSQKSILSQIGTVLAAYPSIIIRVTEVLKTDYSTEMNNSSRKIQL